MKNVFFLLVTAAFLFFTACDAQKRELNKINKQIESGENEQILEATERIKTVLEEEEAKNSPEVWITKAYVYMEAFGTEDPELLAKIDGDPLDIAYESLEKAKEVDTENVILLPYTNAKLRLSQLYQHAGVTAYDKGKFAESSEYFITSFDISKSFDDIDTVTLYYSAYAAEMGQLYEVALDRLEQLVEYEYYDTGVFISLINVSAALQDAKRANKWINSAHEVFGDDIDISIIFAAANYYLRAGDVTGAEKAISDALAREPDNANLYYALGANYERIYTDDSFPKEDREDAFEKAINAYQKSNEIRPEQFEVVFSIGALYFNKGIAIFDEAESYLREDYDFDAYKEREKMFKEQWIKAQPFLEDAKELISPEHENFSVVIVSLTELYARTNQEEKLKEIMDLRKEHGIDIPDED